MSKHIISLEFFFLEFYRSYRSIVDKTLVLTFFLLAGYFVHAQESIITNNKVKLEEIRSEAGFIHPGIGCTAETLENLREGVLKGQSPWVDYFS